MTASPARAETMIRIEPLEAHSRLIPLVAGWYHQAWNVIEGLSRAALEEELALHLPGTRRTGVTWLAFEQHLPIGTVSIDRADLPGHEHLTPWLASFYVIEERRGAGIGRLLLEHAQRHAVATAMPALYLWTQGTTRLYEAMGWKWNCDAELRGRPIVVMRWDPATG